MHLKNFLESTDRNGGRGEFARSAMHILYTTYTQHEKNPKKKLCISYTQLIHNSNKV